MQSSPYAYISQIYKSYYLVDSLVANLQLSADQPLKEYLVIAKPNSIEVFGKSQSQENIESVCKIQIFGTILKMVAIPSIKQIINNEQRNNAMRIEEETCADANSSNNSNNLNNYNNSNQPDLLFILTNELQYVVCQVKIDRVVEVSAGDLSQFGMQEKLANEDVRLWCGSRPKEILYNISLEPDLNSQKGCKNIEIEGWIGLYSMPNEIKVLQWSRDAQGILSMQRHYQIGIEYDGVTDVMYLGNLDYRNPFNQADLLYFSVGVLYKKENNAQYYFNEISCNNEKEYNAKQKWNIAFGDLCVPVYKIIPTIDGGILVFTFQNILYYRKNQTTASLKINSDCQTVCWAYNSFASTFDAKGMSRQEFIVCDGFKASFSNVVLMLSPEQQFQEANNYNLDKGASLMDIECYNNQKQQQQSNKLNDNNIINLDSSTLQIQFLGTSSIASSLTPLSKNMLFLGSTTDNSFIYRVLSNHSGNPFTPFLEPVLELINLAHIADISLLKSELNSSIIVASPLKKDQVNVFQKGTSLTCLASITFPRKPKDLFAILDTFFIVTFENCFVFYTLHLQNNNQNPTNNQPALVFQPLPTPHFLKHRPQIIHASSLFSSDVNANNKWILLITTSSLFIIKLSLDSNNAIQLEEHFKMDFLSTCQHVSLSRDNKFLSIVTTDNRLFIYTIHFSVDQRLCQIQLQNSREGKQLERSVSSLAILSLKDFLIIAFSYWFLEKVYFVQYVQHNSQEGEAPGCFQEPCEMQLKNEQIVRSLLFDSPRTLIIGLNDGSILYNSFDTVDGFIAINKEQQQLVVIGQSQVTLSQCANNHNFNSIKNNVNDDDDAKMTFAYSNYCVILKQAGNRLDKIYINSKSVTKIVALHPQLQQNNNNISQSINKCKQFVYLSNNSLQFGKIEELKSFVLQPYCHKSLQLSSRDNVDRMLVREGLCYLAVNQCPDEQENEEHVDILGINEMYDEGDSFLKIIDIQNEQIINTQMFAGLWISSIFFYENDNLLFVCCGSNHHQQEEGYLFVYKIQEKGQILLEKYKLTESQAVIGAQVMHLSENRDCVVIVTGKYLKIYEMGINKSQSHEQHYSSVQNGATLELKELCKKNLNGIIMGVEVKGLLILVSDPIRYGSLYIYSQQDNRILAVANDWHLSALSGRLSCAAFFGDNLFQADDQGVLHLQMQNIDTSGALTDLEKLRLKVISQINLGETVSTMKNILIQKTSSLSGILTAIETQQYKLPAPIKLVTPMKQSMLFSNNNANSEAMMNETEAQQSELQNDQQQDSEQKSTQQFNSVLCATELGTISLITRIPEWMYRLLYEIQSSYLEEIKGQNGFNHKNWRKNKQVIMAQENNFFIESELMNQFVQLPKDRIERVLQRTSIGKPPFEAILKIIENMDLLLFQ